MSRSNSRSPLSGIHTALITPFDPSGNIDLEGFKFHIARQLEAGVSGILVCGSTGESATLNMIEKERLLKAARHEAEDLCIIAGCGTYSTTQTIENIQQAAYCGCDYALVVAPFYNKPSQEGLFQHFEALSKTSPLPIIVYNNPSRSVVNIDVQTLQRISELPTLCGVKECTNNMTQFSDVIFSIKQKRPEFAILCGDDILTLITMALGCDGLISGCSNIIPEQMVNLVQTCLDYHFKEAQKLYFDLFPLFKALCLESNPVPLKAALELCGLPAGKPRLPLTPLSSHLLPHLKESLQVLEIWSNAMATS